MFVTMFCMARHMKRGWGDAGGNTWAVTPGRSPIFGSLPMISHSCMRIPHRAIWLVTMDEAIEKQAYQAVGGKRAGCQRFPLSRDCRDSACKASLMSKL